MKPLKAQGRAQQEARQLARQKARKAQRAAAPKPAPRMPTPNTMVDHAINAAVNTMAANPALPSITAANAPAIAAAVTTELAANPVFTNALNNESPIQSRVLVGNTLASFGIVLSGLIKAANYFGWHIPDVTDQLIQWLGAAALIGGVGYSYYGRLKKGLVPLFWRQPVPAS